MGDRVMGVTAFQDGFGSFAEECLALASSTFRVPDGVADVEAAGFWIPHLTGWIGLVDRGHLAGDEWLAVLGAGGGSGIAAVQLGRLLGARSSPLSATRIGPRSADHLAPRRRSTTATVPLAPALRELTGGHGVDVIYDPVGGPWPKTPRVRSPGTAAGWPWASPAGTWPKAGMNQLVLANASLMGVLAGGYCRAELDDIHARLAALVAEGGCAMRSPSASPSTISRCASAHG